MKHRTPITIRFRDLDAMNHVNNAVFITYVEQGRIGYFRKVIGRNHDWSKFGTLLAHTSIDYLHPILLDDELYCDVEIVKIGEKSIDVHFELVVVSDEGSKLCAKGKNVLVCFDNAKMSTALVPEQWRKKVEHFNVTGEPLTVNSN